MTEAASLVLAGRVVLVTGAHGGFGSEAARACSRAGATVILLGRKLPRLNRLYDRIAAEGGEPVIYPMDLEGASPDDHLQLAERIASEFGRLDGLLHCAAEFRGLTPAANADPAEFARSVHVGLTAPWWLTQATLPLLTKAEDAAIVFTIDTAPRAGASYWGGYGVAQSGLEGMVRILHAELANSPVRVAGLAPGPMRTALRARAFVEDADRQALDPARYAPAAVELLSRDGIRHRGTLWSPAA